MLNIITIALGVVLGQLALLIAIYAFLVSKPGLQLYMYMVKKVAAKLEELM